MFLTLLNPSGLSTQQQPPAEHVAQVPLQPETVKQPYNVPDCCVTDMECICCSAKSSQAEAASSYFEVGIMCRCTPPSVICGLIAVLTCVTAEQTLVPDKAAPTTAYRSTARYLQPRCSTNAADSHTQCLLSVASQRHSICTSSIQSDTLMLHCCYISLHHISRCIGLSAVSALQMQIGPAQNCCYVNASASKPGTQPAGSVIRQTCDCWPSRTHLVIVWC